MGGIGSGWQCERKLAVEDCLMLPASLCRRKVAEGTSASGTVSWSYPGANPFASIRYVATCPMTGLDTSGSDTWRAASPWTTGFAS